MHLQENTLYDLIKGTQNVAQYPPHHMTYAPAEFELTTSNSLEDAFTSKYIIWPWGKGHTKCRPVVPVHHVI